MKYLLLFVLFTLSAPTLSAQNKAVRDFIREHRKGEENIALTIPGFLIGLVANIGEVAADDPEEELAFRLARNFGTIRFVTFDNRDFNTREDISDVIAALEGEHGYERWASIRAASGQAVQLTVKMKKEEVREIVAVISDPDEERTVFAHFRTDLTAEELGDIINEAMAAN